MNTENLKTKLTGKVQTINERKIYMSETALANTNQYAALSNNALEIIRGQL